MNIHEGICIWWQFFNKTLETCIQNCSAMAKLFLLAVRAPGWMELSQCWQFLKWLTVNETSFLKLCSEEAETRNTAEASCLAKVGVAKHQARYGRAVSLPVFQTNMWETLHTQGAQSTSRQLQDRRSLHSWLRNLEEFFRENWSNFRRTDSRAENC